jgi:hypothetical protein
MDKNDIVRTPSIYTSKVFGCPWKKALERVTGIEPAQPAWKAGTLPLSYTREDVLEINHIYAGMSIWPENTG